MWRWIAATAVALGYFAAPAGGDYEVGSCGALSGPGTVRFSGRVSSAGARIPTRGIVLALQGFEGARWQTFEDLRKDNRGRWARTHSFRGVPGTYPIRVRIRRQSRFPFVLGYSSPVRIRIR